MRLSPASILRLPEVRIDRAVLLFTLGASLLTGIVFGIVPALQGSAAGLGEALNEGSRGASGRRGKRIRSLLVVTEFALALVLLVGAGCSCARSGGCSRSTWASSRRT